MRVDSKRVRLLGQSGKHLLGQSITGFDPKGDIRRRSAASLAQKKRKHVRHLSAPRCPFGVQKCVNTIADPQQGMEELRGAIAEAQRANAPDWDEALLRLAWRARRSVSAPTPASCAPATVPAGIARPDLSPAESRWHPGPARRGSEPDADRSDAEERCSETTVWKEREPTVWKETTIDESRSTDERRMSDEGRSSNEGGTSNKPAAKARTSNKPSA
jgi:hypothetical protein